MTTNNNTRPKLSPPAALYSMRSNTKRKATTHRADSQEAMADEAAYLVYSANAAASLAHTRIEASSDADSHSEQTHHEGFYEPASPEIAAAVVAYPEPTSSDVAYPAVTYVDATHYAASYAEVTYSESPYSEPAHPEPAHAEQISQLIQSISKRHRSNLRCRWDIPTISTIIDTRRAAAYAETAHLDATHPEPTRTEPTHLAAAYTEAPHLDATHPANAHPESTPSESPYSESTYSEDTTSEVTSSESAYSESTYSEPAHPEPAHAEQISQLIQSISKRHRSNLCCRWDIATISTTIFNHKNAFQESDSLTLSSVQNKPNFDKKEFLLSFFPLKTKDKSPISRQAKNKPNSNPIQTHSKPFLKGSNPNRKPKITSSLFFPKTVDSLRPAGIIIRFQ